eukprot:11064301-Heterocapsa_arctica.AAC.1
MAPFAGARGERAQCVRSGRGVPLRERLQPEMATEIAAIEALGRIMYMRVKPPKTALTQPTYALAFQ